MIQMPFRIHAPNFGAIRALEILCADTVGCIESAACRATFFDPSKFDHLFQHYNRGLRYNLDRSKQSLVERELSKLKDVIAKGKLPRWINELIEYYQSENLPLPPPLEDGYNKQLESRYERLRAPKRRNGRSL